MSIQVERLGEVEKKLKMGHLDAARTLHDKWFAGDDACPESIALAALIMLEEGKSKEALRRLKPILGACHKSSAILTAHGRIRLNLGESNKAQALFQKALEHDAQSYGARYGLGRIAEQQGDLNGAILHYRDAFFQHPYDLKNSLALVDAQKRHVKDHHGIDCLTFAELANQQYRQDLATQRAQIERLLGSQAASQFKSRQTPFISLACDKCGTHLLADVLQGISGLCSNWQYHDPNQPMALRAPKAPQPGEFIAGNWFPNSAMLEGMQARNEKAVLLYRDPRDQIVSCYFYCKRSHALIEESGFAQRIAAMSKEEAIDELMNTWPHNMLMWLQLWFSFERPLYACSFERMISDKAAVVGEISTFLGYPPDETLIRKVAEETAFDKPSASLKIESLHSDFKRKGKAGDWRNHFSPDNVERFKKIAGDILIALGYEQDYNW